MAIAMAEYTYLKNAPIFEAVIDLRVKLPGNFDTNQLRIAASSIHDEYPITEDRNSVSAMLQVAPQGSTLSAQAPKFQGLFLKTPDQRQIAQFRIDGFAFSRLKPYTKWEEVSKEARRLWEVYVNYCSPLEVTRIAVRYINRMEIPFGSFELSDYLTAPPSIPQELEASFLIAGYFHRTLITDKQREVNTIIIQTAEPIDDPEKSILVLDIDSYRVGEFSIDEGLFGTLDILRDVKNDIFFKSLTEKAVELFK